jgi:hypothetical protein
VEINNALISKLMSEFLDQLVDGMQTGQVPEGHSVHLEYGHGRVRVVLTGCWTEDPDASLD